MIDENSQTIYMDEDSIECKVVRQCLKAEYRRGYSDAIKHGAKNAHSVDVEPVKHGHWIHHHDVIHYGERDGAYWQCSSCGRILKDSNWFPYCPICGARMGEQHIHESD